MKDRFVAWLERNRRTIGYTAGGLNVLAGVNYLFQGHGGMGLLWLMIGIMLMWDTWEFR
jgi:hypothetical protein